MDESLELHRQSLPIEVPGIVQQVHLQAPFGSAQPLADTPVRRTYMVTDPHGVDAVSQGQRLRGDQVGSGKSQRASTGVSAAHAAGNRIRTPQQGGHLVEVRIRQRRTHARAADPVTIVIDAADLHEFDSIRPQQHRIARAPMPSARNS